MIRTLFRIATLTGYFTLLILWVVWIAWLSEDRYYPVALGLLFWAGPLLLPLRGLLYGRSYTHAWCSFMAIYYFVLSVDAVAAGNDPTLAWISLVASIVLFTGCVGYVRFNRSS